MSSSPQTPNPPVQRNSDEIDLGELMLRIWATRVIVVKAVLVVLALVVCYIGVSYLLSNKTVRYSQVFDLTFEGLRSGEFPNGSPFLISDITSPTVLNRVYRQNGLEDFGLDLDEFRRSVNIQSYAPNYALIRAKYDGLLADKKLTPADIADLQKQMLAELQAARSGAVIITMLLPQSRSLTSDVAQKVLLDIPKAWASRAITEQGVLKPNLPVYSERIFDKQRFDNLDYLLGMDLLLENIRQIRGNIANLKTEPNASTLIDDESGFTLVDLDKAIQDVADYDIRQIIDPIKELGISRKPEVVRLYYTRRLADLQQEQELWRLRSQTIRSVLNVYSREASTASNVEGGPAAQSNLVPQLGDAFLDRLLEVSRQGSDLDFRQKMTEEILNYENKAIDLEQQVNDIRRILTTMGAVRKEDEGLRSIYVDVVEEQLPSVLDSLRTYTQIMVRMYEKQGRQSAGNISQLVEPQGGSFIFAEPRLVSSRELKIAAVVVILAFFLSVAYGLFRGVVRSRVVGAKFD